MREIVRYITGFLLGDEYRNDLIDLIGYTADRSKFHQYNIVILPSGFFDNQYYGRRENLPSVPLAEIEGIPLLYGSPVTEWYYDTLVIHADIIASSYFLLTRYEEMIRRDIRDEHGRFPGKESLPFRAGFLQRPIVDEYGSLLIRWLRETGIEITEREKRISAVYLTHDVDAPYLYRSWKGFIRSLIDKRGFVKSLSGLTGTPEQDPWFTFPWLFDINKKAENKIASCETILFFRCGGKKKEDKPHYRLTGKDLSFLIHMAKQRGNVRFGLHSSYEAGQNPFLIPREKIYIEKILGERVTCNRHHFLRACQPEDMEHLQKACIIDDFTMGYPDVAGFRLGTSRPVRWINPATRRISLLTLHPLTIMDCTLEEKKYMGLSEGEAYDYCTQLIGATRKAGGELVLLWHNTSVVEENGSYLKELYNRLISDLIQQ